MKIKPIFDRVLLRPVKKQNSLGLILPDEENKSTLMEVVAVGNDEKGFVVNIGDKVLINTFSGFAWTLDKETFLLVKQTDILAVVKEDEDDEKTDM